MHTTYRYRLSVTSPLGNRIVPAVIPRVAAQYPPRTEARAAQQPMPGQRLAGIVRAGRAEPAGRSQQWAQAILIEPDQPDDHPRHRCTRSMSISASSTSCCVSCRRTLQRRRTTRSSPASSLCRARNVSRNSRFTRLRETARRSILPGITIPRRECASSLGLANTCRNFPLTEHLNRITDENSSARCSRQLFKKRIVRSPVILRPVPRGLHSQTGAPLGATRPDDGGPAHGFHADPKAMCALPPGHGRLVGTFHRCPFFPLRSINKTPHYNSLRMSVSTYIFSRPCG